MLLDLALVLPSTGSPPSDAAGQITSAEGSGDPFAALLAALVAAPPMPSLPQNGEAGAPPLPDLLPQLRPQLLAEEVMLAPAPPLQLAPAPVVAEDGSKGVPATQPGDPRPLPPAEAAAPLPAIGPEPSGHPARGREGAVEAPVLRPALPTGTSGAPPQGPPPGITMQPASPPPRPEVGAGAVPLLRQDGGGGPPPEVRLDSLAAAAKPTFTPGAIPDARPPALQIALQIAHAAPHRIEQMRVQLHPAALGQVEVRLEFGEHGRVRALIAVERPETLEVLQRDAPALERSLHDAGLRTDPGALSFSLRRERDPWPQGGPRAGPADRAAGAAGGEVAPDPVAWRSGRHLIDVHV